MEGIKKGKGSKVSEKRDDTSMDGVLSTSIKKGHIMISYDWSHQKEVIKIRDCLKEHGYAVWMDIDNMGGSTLQSMAKAVEHAHIILICMSCEYKDSPNCRAEAEYAFYLKKEIVPLKMEKNYDPDGWLGILCGSKLCYDFSGKYSFEAKIKELIHAISMIPYGNEDAEPNIVPIKSQRRQTDMEGIKKGKGSKVSKKGEDASMDGVVSTSIKKGHIMISYQWSDQKEVIKIRDCLKEHGYAVWMDIDNMGGSTIQSMAEAVENAHIILICMSQQYKYSASCRKEAEYAYQLRKKIVLLKMEIDYQPDGWLGFIVADEPVYDFSGKYLFEAKIKELIREISISYGNEDAEPTIVPIKSQRRQTVMEDIKKGKGSQVSKKGEDASVDQVLSTSIKKDPLLPVEILSMDDNFIQLYKKALHAGKEKVYNIRVMVVGQFGVGKTTLIKRLLGQPVDISERKSTEGIDVHKHCCKISLDKGKWIQQVEDSDQLQTLNRLIKLLLVPDQKPDINQDQEGINQVVYQREITSELDATKSNVPSTTSVSDQEVQSSTQVSITEGYEIHPLSDAKSSDNKKKTKDAMMEIIRLVNANADKLVKDIEKYAALSIWDFAGQCAFYTTHQMFLTSRAIYLLVIDLSQQITDDIKDDDKCFLDADGIVLRQVFDLFQIWINSIHSIVKSPKDIVPVIVVGTHVDKIPEKSRKEVIDKYFKKLRYRLKDKPTKCHLMGYIAIDNTQPHPMLEELKKSIFELSSQQPHWGEERPARWLPLEQAIMTLKASDTKIVPLSLIEEINMSGSIKIGRDELKLFLQFHHDIGTILHFSVEELRENIVLDPQWMIDALKSLITAETFIEKYPAITRKFYEFIETGKLTHELIDVIWSKENNLEFHNHKDHILRLMEQLNIIAKPRIFSKEGKKNKEEHYFLAPCMLQEKTPEEIISPKPNKQMESSPVLCYVFTGNFLPSAIFHRLVAACIAHWPVAKMKKEHREENLIFCGCCVFQLDEQDKLTLHFREHVIFLRVTRMGIKDKTPSSKLCIEVRQFITTNLVKIIGYLGKGLKFEYFIQCPEYNGVSINSLIPVSRLKEKEEVHCEFHDNMIESCKVLDFWFEHQEQTVIESIEKGKESKVSEQGEDASMDTSIKKEKLHMTVLIRCLPRLLECLDVKVVMIYIQQEELFDPVTTRDINEQTTTTAQILCLIEQIKKRDQHTYVRFKECLIRAQQGHLKRMLDEKEENLVAEMKEKHREKLHWTVLNRCLPNLMKDLNVQDVMMYIQQKELLDDLTLRDISEQTTTTDKISHLIDQIKKRDQDTYVRFKECLILAKRADLKIMLEEEEKNIAAEMKEKHQGAEASKVKSQMQAGAKKELDEPQTKLSTLENVDSALKTARQAVKKAKSTVKTRRGNQK